MKIRMKSPKVVIYSILALGFIALAFFLKEWLFLIGAVVLMFLNQKELNNMKGRIKKK